MILHPLPLMFETSLPLLCSPLCRQYKADDISSDEQASRLFDTNKFEDGLLNSSSNYELGEGIG